MRQFGPGPAGLFMASSAKRDQSGRTFGGSGAGEQLHGGSVRPPRARSGSALFRAASIAAVTAGVRQPMRLRASRIPCGEAGSTTAVALFALPGDCDSGVAAPLASGAFFASGSKGQHLCEQRRHRLDAPLWRRASEPGLLWRARSGPCPSPRRGFAPRRVRPSRQASFGGGAAKGHVFVLQDIRPGPGDAGVMNFRERGDPPSTVL